MKTSLIISISIVAAVIVITAGIIPYLFHDFKLTVTRSDFIIDGLKIISQDQKPIEELGISDAFVKADSAFEKNKETGRNCFDYAFYSRNICKSETNIKAFRAYEMLEKLPFKDNTWQFFYLSADDKTVAKEYVVYLNSINWNNYVAFGLIISVTSLTLFGWILVRFEKSLTRVQNQAARLIVTSFLDLIMKLNLKSKSKYMIPIILVGFSLILISYTNYTFVLGENFTACYSVFLFGPGLLVLSFGIIFILTKVKIAILTCLPAAVTIYLSALVITMFTGLPVFPNCGPIYS